MPRINLGNNENAKLDKLPDKCPYCHKSISPLLVQPHRSANNLEVIFSCPNPNCKQSFIATYRNESFEDYTFRSTNVGTPIRKVFAEEIETISPSFIRIYNEAFFAEQNHLFEICGVGYRKSLEFLIKDYAILNYPDKEEEIKSKFLGNCIDLYVSDDKIKKVAKRAAWIGNDETHYVRRWEGKDLNDLKKLINLTVHWIEMEHLTNSFENEMPD